MVYLVGDILAAVAVEGIGPAVAWRDAPFGHVGIIARIQVDGQSPCMVGELLLSRHRAVVERRSVVILHRPYVIAVIVIHQHHPLDAVASLIELAEDAQHPFGNLGVHHHLPQLRTSLRIPVEHPQVAQLIPVQRTVLFPRLPLHALEGSIAQRLCREAVLQSRALHLLVRHDGLRLPFLQEPRKRFSRLRRNGEDNAQQQQVYNILFFHADKGSANERKKQILFDFFRMQPTHSRALLAYP